MVDEELIERLFQEIYEEKLLLKEISYKLQGDDDLLLQFPDELEEYLLGTEPSEGKEWDYEKEIVVNKKLMFLEYKVGSGYAVIYRNGEPFAFFGGKGETDTGFIQFKDGVYFETLKVYYKIIIPTEEGVPWSIKMVFS